VLLNQLSLFVVLAFAFGVGGDGRSAPTLRLSFMQMPYAVVVVRCSVSSRRNSLHVDRRQHRRLSERLRFGLRQSLVIISRARSCSGARAADRLDTGEALQRESRWDVGTVLAVLAAGLPGFTIFQLVCAACSRCNVRARSSISTRFKIADHCLVHRHRSPLDR